MMKKLLCGAAALGLVAQFGAAQANEVIINGVAHNANGGTINVPYGHHGANCCAPTTSYSAQPATTYVNQPASAYTTVPATSYVSEPVTYTEPTTSYISEPVSQGELVYIDEPAPVTYAQPAEVITTPVVYEQAAPVMAEPRASGWSSRVYVGARGGWSAARDTQFRLAGGGVRNEYDDAGYNIAAVVGWGAKISNGIGYRLEAELGYQTAEIDSHRVGGNTFSGGNAFGDTKTLYGFANAYLDVPIFARLNGVVGGGLGVGKVEFDGHGIVNGGAPVVAADDEDTAFGYHLDAGVSYDVTDRLALEAMYRYTSFVDVELTSADGTRAETDVDTHNVLIGARYGF